MLPRPFRVQEVRRDTADTVTLWLEAVDGRPLESGSRGLLIAADQRTHDELLEIVLRTR